MCRLPDCENQASIFESDDGESLDEDIEELDNDYDFYPVGSSTPRGQSSLFLCTVHLNVFFSIIREQNLMKIDRHVLDTYAQALTEPKVGFQPF